jgi:plastocyanin
VTAGVGQPIAFTNEDPTPHTATVDDGSCNSGSIAGGAAQTLVFNIPGIYAYHCEFHKSMRGTITISG